MIVLVPKRFVISARNHRWRRRISSSDGKNSGCECACFVHHELESRRNRMHGYNYVKYSTDGSQTIESIDGDEQL